MDEDGRSRNVAVTAPTSAAVLENTVDVKNPAEPLRLVSVTAQDQDKKLVVNETYVFKFNAAVTGAEAGDFRLDGNSSRVELQ